MQYNYIVKILTLQSNTKQLQHYNIIYISIIQMQ